MLKRLRIGTKIRIAFTSIAVVAISLIAFLAFSVGSRTLREESFNKLTAVREMKSSQIEDYFQLIQDQVVTFSEDRMIIEAMQDFEKGLRTIEGETGGSGWGKSSVTESDIADIDADLESYYREEFLPRLSQNLSQEVAFQNFWPEDDTTRILQYRYITDNPFEVGSKQLLDNAGDGTNYSQSHEEFHPIIRNFQETFGYYDIFLVDINAGGHIAYSVFKEIDFGTSLLDGPYADSNIGRVYKAALNANDKDAVFLADYDPYAPSYNAPAAFIASPIFNGNKKIGILIFQMPIDRIDAIMTNNQDWKAVGLGDSGETYLVGDDFTLRNQSRFLIEDRENYFKLIEELGTSSATIDQIRNLNTTISLQDVRTEGTQAALSGETGIGIFPDYRGVPVLSSYKPLEITDFNWVIMSEIDAAEALSPIRSLGLSLTLASTALIALIVMAATIFSRFITKPIEDLQLQARQISDGNLETRISVDTDDEISDLANALDTMRLSNKGLIDNLADINKNLKNLVAERTVNLKASERQSNSIIELSSDAIIVIDDSGQVLVWNAQAEAIFGYAREDMVGHPMDLIIPDVYKTGHTKEFARAGDMHSLKNPGITHELSGQHKNGQEFPIELTLSHWQLEGKSFFSGTLRDITERKEAERKLAKSEAKHRTIFQNSPLGMILFDRNGFIADCNDRFVELMGSSKEQLIGFHTLKDASDPTVRQRLGQALAGEQTDFEGEYTSATGNMHRILRIIYNPVNPNQSPTEVIATVEDIYERKEMERLLQIANERMTTELNFAHDIQMSMLPLIFPAFPTRKEVIVHAILDSAREVGGDFYDFYFLDDDHLCFVIGDVAGKGAPGALMMAVSKTLIKSRAADDSEPASILTHVNNELSRDNNSSMFVTVFLGVINVKTGTFIYTNAGHNPPYIKRHDGTLQKVNAFHGPVIGAMPDLSYQQDKDVLHPGDVILLFTDGVTEAFNEADQLFSETRLEELLYSELFDSAKGIVDGTLEAVNRFVGAAEQSDDITLLAVQYLGLPESMETREHNITIKNRFEDMELVEEQFSNFAQENELSNISRQRTSVVLDEMLNNIISYGYPGEKEKDIEIRFELSGNRLVLTIKDSGTPFNPFEQGTPDISASIDEREPGGLGIHMVRNMMDEYAYQRQINKNVVTFVMLIE
ncbi:MAG: PAS domain S-box-containing protein [Arenicella sp.]|jgi:PAS domain S-box-containing protein